ncbi:hypothetical protein L1887_59998 [Cichorium endivia]|nr:hypothetical protein L1887_59998 [Cichorium endivia]
MCDLNAENNPDSSLKAKTARETLLINYCLKENAANSIGAMKSPAVSNTLLDFEARTIVKGIALEARDALNQSNTIFAILHIRLKLGSNSWKSAQVCLRLRGLYE